MDSTTAVNDFIHEVLKQDNCPLRPCENRVILQMDDKKSEYGKIIIPQSAQDQPMFATIVAIGMNTSTTDEWLQVGDRILFGKYSGNVVKVADQEYLVLRIEDILAKVER